MMKNLSTREINFLFWIVKYLIPKRVIYFSFMHVMVYSTTGKYGNTIVPELSGMDAIDRYGKDNL